MSDTPASGADDDLDVLLRAWARQQRAATGPAPAPLATDRLPGQAAERGRLVTAAAAALVVVAAVAAMTVARSLPADRSSPPVAALPVVAVDEVRPHLARAALTRPLAFDGGRLRLDPPSSATPVDEPRALALWRSGSSGLGSTSSVWESGVVIARADITLTIPVLDRLPVRPARPATFTRRTGWVVLSDPDQAACPAQTWNPSAPRDTGGPRALSIWLLSGDGTAAVDYTSAGAGLCGAPGPGPRAQASGTTSTTRPAGPGTAPATCSSVSNTVGGTTYASTLLAPGPCTGGGLDPALELGPLVVSIVTDPGGPFTYFDGTARRDP